MFKKENNVKEAGFTLIELGILLGIAGLLAAIALNEYSQYTKEKASSDTGARKFLVESALSAFVGNFGRLPCPADPSLAPTNILAGVEICIANPPPALLPAVPVTAPVVPVNKGNVFRVEGFRDTYADADVSNDPVLIGSVPYVTLGITHIETMDGWGSTFTYAVSEHMTVTYDDNNGVIRRLSRSTVSPDIPPLGALDPNNVGDGGDIFPDRVDVRLAPMGVLTSTANAFLIALVSHGEDRRGGYSYQGNLIDQCDTITPSLDSLNCDLDAEFINADSTTGIYNFVPGVLFFDDAFAVFTIGRDGDKWAYTSGNTIENRTGGRVGIGMAPDTLLDIKLDVRGNILISNQYKTNKYCDSDGIDCFDSEIIGGPLGISCSNGLMTGIASSNVVCATQIDPTLIVTGSCPIGEFMKGITGGGAIICAP